MISIFHSFYAKGGLNQKIKDLTSYKMLDKVYELIFKYLDKNIEYFISFEKFYKKNFIRIFLNDNLQKLNENEINFIKKNYTDEKDILAKISFIKILLQMWSKLIKLNTFKNFM